MKAIIIPLVIFFILTGFISMNAEAAVISINNDELLGLSRKGVTIIDIRTAREWQETGVIPGSHLLTLFDDARHVVDPGGWLNRVKATVKPNQPVILICRVGNRTVPATQLLDTSGYKTVYNATGGIQSWIRAGLPITRTDRQ